MIKLSLVFAIVLAPWPSPIASFAQPAAKPVPHKTGIVHTPQVDLGYITLGSRNAALPVIAVNGGPGLSHVYMVQNDMWDRVAQHRLVVFYDQRGTGASKKLQPKASMTMDAQVADLDAVRAALNLDKVALVGDSYGGFIAMAYAAAHPEHVAKLVLSDAAGPSYKGMVRILPDVFPDIEEQSAVEQKKLASDPEAAAQAGLRSHFRMIFYSLEKEQAYMAHAGDIGFVPAVADAVSTAAANLDLASSLPDFHFPTLVITGRWDMNVAPVSAWRIAKAIPGAHFEVFEKSGHLPSYEEPEKYRNVLEKFLNAK
jgi:proline iminopeptidase